MIRRTALALAVACVAAAPAYADDVCSGVIWKVTGAIRRLNNGGGTMYAKDVVELEIGHGLYQCSVRGRRNVERVLATCRLGEMCTLRAKIVTPFNPDTAGRSLIIKPRDRILSVRRGADDDNGEAGK